MCATVSQPWDEWDDSRVFVGAESGHVALRALLHDGEITGLGRVLSRLPVDPSVGRMVLHAHGLGVGPVRTELKIPKETNEK